MAWTAKKASSPNETNRQGFIQKGTAYPSLPNILDEYTLTELTTFESGEKEFVQQQGRDKHRYLTALYLKAMSALSHSHYQPKDLPLQFRRELTDKLNFSDQLTKILTISKQDKKRIVDPIRTFLDISNATSGNLNKLKLWLEKNIAHKETNPQILINAAVYYLRDHKIELPIEEDLETMVS
ncbi:MAG: DUF4158 domain-containing protein, partial [Thermotogota bacterium]|nr:DUF4158 domain-containing protein [Thermotogota bacterium]